MKNRELKFRAWAIGSNKMLHDVGVHPSISMANEGYDPGEPGWLTVSPRMESYVVMQYTGMKDDEGKEMYEGDVVEMDDDGDLITGPIEFETDSWWIGGQIEDSLASKLEDYGLKVIGNIHQNPELINIAKNF